MFKRTYHPLFLILIFTLSMTAFAQQKRSSDSLWRQVAETSASMRSAERAIIPDEYRTFRLNKVAMRAILDNAPEELSDPYGMSDSVITLPMPNGGFERFRIEHSPIVEPALLAQFPELGATYHGRGIDDPTATVRFDLLSNGFHSMILSPRGTMMVDPYSKTDTDNYISYFKRDVRRTADYSCDFEVQNSVESILSPKSRNFSEMIPDVVSPQTSSGTTRRTYRLALAATGEYTAAVGGGTVAGALAAQVLIMNRVNGVFERDLAIRMVIIGTNNLIVYTDGATDPYTNSNGLTMLSENQTNLDAVIAPANYDIGHIFSTGGGGIASVGVPCGPSKGRGVTGLSNPTGDVFAIDFVAHEIGHQFGAFHTFNGGVGNCSGSNRTAGSAYEPGSGVTIMGYAGICGNQNLAGNSIDTFHIKSIEDIIAFSQTGNGSTCAAMTSTGNSPPVVTNVGGSSFNVPRQTPFTLTASATDADGDAVTYDWQQYDLGGGTSIVPNSDGDGTARPLFRPYTPTSNPARTFPASQFILANANVPPNTTAGFMTGELMAGIARTMNFQVIARDNRSNGGGIGTVPVSVVITAAGPFSVNAPNTNTTWFLNSNPLVTWNVGGSDGAPVNTANVRILLSTDGGLSFPTVLSASTPNDGSEAVVTPAISTGQARIRIEAVGNIFFDVSDNFAISASASPDGALAGRITSASGRGAPRVYVVMTGGNPSMTRVAFTNSFGYYQFASIPFGQTYTITPTPQRGKTYTPSNIVRDHSSSATDVNFTAQ